LQIGYSTRFVGLDKTVRIKSLCLAIIVKHSDSNFRVLVSRAFHKYSI
jgi:hypothetical protein